jgi:hypothetical protein
VHFRTTLGLVGLAALSVACGPAPGQGIVDRIRAADAPIVQEVILSPVNFWGGKDYEDIYLYLVSDVTDQEAFDLWCDVIIPAGADRLGPEGHVYLEKGVVKYANGSQSGGIRVLWNEPICGPGATFVPTIAPPPTPIITPPPQPFLGASCTTLVPPAPAVATDDCALEMPAVLASVADFDYRVATVLILPWSFPCGKPFPPADWKSACAVSKGRSTAYVTFVGTDKVAALTFTSSPTGRLAAEVVAFDIPLGNPADYRP